MNIDKLQILLAPPRQPLEIPTVANWITVEAQIGNLPDDYKAFVEHFGTGVINGFIWILNPVSKNRHLNLLQQIEPVLGALKELRENGEPSPYPLFPESGGLLPFGKTDNGDALFWLTQGKPNDWPVVVNAARDATYQKFACHATEFLAGVLTRRIRCSIFNESFPVGPATFTPSA